MTLKNLSQKRMVDICSEIAILIVDVYICSLLIIYHLHKHIYIHVHMSYRRMLDR
ncbi:hypothetical protein HanRHA438_Chr12g0544791 [Helianthus annuus]|nr:hypothetical protein HanRHA438_Chr12g0544791 [Helianthus annuus]